MGLPRAPSSSADLPLAAPSSPARWRLWLVLLAVGWNGIFMFTNVGWKVFGLDIGGFAGQYPLFMDSMAVLAAAETHHRGGNPFKPMWLDPFHRVHSYSSWWFGLGDLGLTRADNGWFGGLLVLAFAVAVGLRLRARASGEFWWLLGTVGSLPFLIATRRANNDLVVFVLLAPLVPCLLHPSRLVRLAAPFLIAVAAGLKYYPLVAGVALLAEPDRRYRRFRLGVLALLLLMVGLSVGGDLKYLAASQPDVEGYQGFGAGFGLGLRSGSRLPGSAGGCRRGRDPWAGGVFHARLERLAAPDDGRGAGPAFHRRSGAAGGVFLGGHELGLSRGVRPLARAFFVAAGGGRTGPGRRPPLVARRPRGLLADTLGWHRGT